MNAVGRDAGLLLALALMTGCASATQEVRPGGMSHFAVLALGQDAGGDFCKDFRLTSRQVEAFFSRARETSPQQLHDGFDLLPCWVRGTAHSAQGMVEWEIRAGATARVNLPDGSVRLLGCDDCETLMTGK